MDRAIHPEIPGQSPERRPDRDAEKAENQTREENLPPRPQAAELANLNEIPAAPQKPAVETEAVKPPFKSVDELVGQMGEIRKQLETLGGKSGFDASRAKKAQDAIRAVQEAKKNQN